MRPLITKTLVTLFILLNLSTVVYHNWPDYVRWQPSLYLPPSLTYQLNRYGHLVGLDNRWLMFSYMYRDDWQVWYRAEYADSTSVDLPLADQAPRSFWQAHFFDFREAKIRLNLYNRPERQKLYGLYLCRQFPFHDGKPVRSVTAEVRSRAIVRPEISRVFHYSYGANLPTWALAKVSCSNAPGGNL